MLTSIIRKSRLRPSFTRVPESAFKFNKPIVKTISITTPVRSASTKASDISTPTEEEYEAINEEEYSIDVSDLKNRWLRLPSEDQLDIINYLNIKQQFGWNFLSSDEKKAIYYISYGVWGPRDQKNLNLPEMIFKIMSSSILFSVLGFSIYNYATDKAKVEEIEYADRNGDDGTVAAESK